MGSLLWGTNISVFSFTGDGLITSNGNRWFRMRKLLTPAFHFEILKPYVRVFQESTDTLLVWSKLVTENLIPPSLAFWKLLVRPDERKENRTFSVADPGGGPGAPLFLDETKARRAEKKLFLRSAPSPLISGFGRPPPSPFYLKAWICHWSYCPLFFLWAFCVFRFVVVLAVVFCSSLNCHKTWNNPSCYRICYACNLWAVNFLAWQLNVCEKKIDYSHNDAIPIWTVVSAPRNAGFYRFTVETSIRKSTSVLCKRSDDNFVLAYIALIC